MSHNILLVDDDQTILLTVKYHLQKNNFKILQASDSHQALEIVKQSPQKIDLIITDLHMEETSGLDLATALRELGYNLPILLMSSDIRAKEEFYSNKKFAVFNDMLIKPAAANVILSKVNQLLAKDVA